MTEASPHSTSQRAEDMHSVPAGAHSRTPGDLARWAFREALSRYSLTQLSGIRRVRGHHPVPVPYIAGGPIDEIVEYLDRPSAVESLLAQLPNSTRLALACLAVTESTSVSLAGLSRALGMLTPEPAAAVGQLLELGLLVIDPGADCVFVRDFASYLQPPLPAQVRLVAHPAVLKEARAPRLPVTMRMVSGPVSQVRESDGLEPILRLGALWQRVGAEPLRQTQQGALYKRDRDRLSGDTVLAGSVADGLKVLPDLPWLWYYLARQIGLVIPESDGDRLLAAPTGFWNENAVHFPQMIATAWMSLESWCELDVPTSEKRAWLSNLPSLRVALLLLLSATDDSDWVSLDDLADQLSRQSPLWASPPVCSQTGAGAGPARGGAKSRDTALTSTRGTKLLESILVGAAYVLGLVRTAQEHGSDNRLVQLTPLGRYVLTLGPTPPPRETFDQFLFVQPNFEVIAYRQGLTPHLVGHLSRFAWWAQIGSALELKLTRDSIVQGLDGGLSPKAILDTLNQHSQRALPAGVIDAVGDWASRRERVTFYASATLIEFGSRTDRDAALASWPDDTHAAPLAVGERFLLVEDERAIPFDRLRLSSSRDYRRPPDVCVTVEPDGVTLALDPARSDLLVDAELARFADELTDRERDAGRVRGPGPSPRRFTVTAATLRRGMSRGFSAVQLGEWFLRRSGGQAPAAIELLLAAMSSRPVSLKASRTVIVTLPSTRLVDGLIQHPVTGPLIGDRLGPFSVSVADDKLGPLRAALKQLGIGLEFDGIEGQPSHG
jgi:hypothetical protein